MGEQIDVTYGAARNRVRVTSGIKQGEIKICAVITFCSIFTLFRYSIKDR